MNAEHPIWALVDARSRSQAGIDATTQLAGLSLASRQVRMAARQGWTGAVVRVVDEADRERTERAIARRPPPSGFEVEMFVGDAEPAGDRVYVPMNATEIYLADELARAADAGEVPASMMRIESPADVRTAEKRMAKLIRKSVDQDGVISYHAFRPISRLMTLATLDTRVTPNQVSSVAMLCGVAAAVLAAFGGYYMVLAAGICYWLGAVVDCVDGEIARLRIEGSKLGEWLDTLADDVSTYGLLAGLGIGLVNDGYDSYWNLIGLGGAAIGVLMQAKIYADLHRWQVTIDTAQYPWFFGAPSDGVGGQRSLVGRIFYGVSFFFRRDAFVTIVAILLACDLRRIATLMLAAGTVIVLFLFLLHVAVTALRRQES